ncbi:D-amino acid dehydrogenase [Zobellella sp. DQSA1]|uniref:D-amino acid dehydrogenase n=1 Tax=Zobellella sp. DQSA1 TaxID=3342386 RepID=UPI0035C0CC2D
MKTDSIAIVGAGIIGITSAYLLSRAGYRVMLLDAGRGPALGTSFANGAQLSYSYTDAMASPGLVAKMPGILLGRDPAFRVRMSAERQLLRWGSRFLMHAQAAREEQNTRNILRLSLHSREVLHRAQDECGIEFGHRLSGKLHIYGNRQDLDKAAIRVQQKGEWGCPQQVLDWQQCLALEPGLAQLATPMAGGVYSSLDEVGDCQHFAVRLLAQLRQQGVEEHYQCRVQRLRKEGNRITGLDTSQGPLTADAYLLATGPDSLALARGIGMALPIYPIKGYSITVPATGQAPDVCITDVDNKVVFARLGDRLRVAGCADIVGYDRELDEQRIAHLLRVCRQRFPEAGDYDRILDRWTGFRPVTPSSAPIIGRAGADNLYLNLGHGMLGWTLAMGSASLLAARLGGYPAPIDDTGLRPIDHGLR